MDTAPVADRRCAAQVVQVRARARRRGRVRGWWYECLVPLRRVCVGAMVLEGTRLLPFLSGLVCLRACSG